MGEARRRGAFDIRKKSAIKRNKEKLLSQLSERNERPPMWFGPVLITTDENGYPDIAASVSNSSMKQEAYRDKAHMETDHITHFKNLLNIQLPEHDFRILGAEKNDPPDFWIERNGETIGLELTMFMFQDLRQEVKFFDEIQNKILDRYISGEIADIQGIEIELWFGKNGANRPRKIEPDELEQLITQLNNLASRPFGQPGPLFDDPAHGLKATPFPYPSEEEGSVGDGFISWRVINVGYTPTKTNLGRIAGFEISHTLKSYRKTDFFNRLQATINAKDKEKNKGHELLISVGMKDMDGWITSVESVCLAIILDEWLTIQKEPKFLSKIYLDCWRTATLKVLYDRH
ncbi:hypothetical protein [Methylophilus sp. 5]|uniref:hypothetical protein n=1 Tax=Methylophilus sp. 5 TaxID=1112274 RepID=UPI00048C7F70|nr:hypothetical protein [Methylophilus sp. 5]